MIPLGGLDTGLALRIVEATRAKQVDLIQREALNARQIEAFHERAAQISSPAEFVADTEVYTFVMRTFDLEDQIFGKAMIRKVLESDISDRTSLVNRLTDPRIRELYEALAFPQDGGRSPNLGDPEWRAAVVDRFGERMLINAAESENRGAGLALEFKARVGSIDSWFDVLKDKDVATFMRRALGLPDEMVKLDIDKQKALFEKKFDIEKLKDPKEVEALVRRFSAVFDAIEGTNLQRNAALTLVSNAVSAGQGYFTPITLDIEAVTAFSASRYR